MRQPSRPTSETQADPVRDALQLAGDLHNRKVTDEMIGFFHKKLRPYPAKEVARGIENCARKRFPTVDEVTAFLNIGDIYKADRRMVTAAEKTEARRALARIKEKIGRRK